MEGLRRDFGIRLRYLRNQVGLTQEQLADAANISVDFVSLIERGINAPSFDNLEKLAKALGVSAQELFTFNKDYFGNNK
jgi:transcriptional regulator with XRE-family HTH domain